MSNERLNDNGAFKYWLTFLLLLLQSALQPLVGFWPAQLSLSLLS